MGQTISFCQSRDGIRLAYGVSGSGAPIVVCGLLYKHLEHDHTFPFWSEAYIRLYPLIRAISLVGLSNGRFGSKADINGTRYSEPRERLPKDPPARTTFQAAGLMG
jgi:hypothetical protein